MTPKPYCNTYSNKVSGTEVNYYVLCKRRCWLARHRIMITRGNPHIMKGKILSNRNRSGHAEIRLGRNRFDITQNKKGNLEIHEYKKSKDTHMSARMQLLHYLCCLEEYGIQAKGVLHALGTKKVEELHLTAKNRNCLDEIYENIVSLDDEDPPPPIEVPLCHSGCSFEEYCWG